MKKYILGAIALAAVAVPSASFAAMFAYVNTSGEVRTVEADSANAALQTAPSIHERSGVMMIDGAADSEIVGDSVSGT
jgi:hypothetical protein